MTLWNPPSVTKEMDNKQVANLVAELIDDVAFIMNGNIDWKNIRAQSIQTENLAAGSITADKIAANAVTASKIDVDELSAISADLGHITAGSVDAITITGSVITGSLIQTQSSGIYPRIELSSTSNILEAESGPGQSVEIDAVYLSGTPAVVWKGINVHYLWELDGELTFTSSSDVTIAPNNFVNFRDWMSVWNLNTNRTLQQDFDSKPDKGITANIVTGDGAGNNVILNFVNGVLVNWDVV